MAVMVACMIANGVLAPSENASPRHTVSVRPARTTWPLTGEPLPGGRGEQVDGVGSRPITSAYCDVAAQSRLCAQRPHQRSARNAAIAAVSSGAAKALP
jgi:hypothetical protein